MSDEKNARINVGLKGITAFANDARPTLGMTPLNEGRSPITMTQTQNTLERARNPGAMTPAPQQQAPQTQVATPSQPSQPSSDTTKK
jgi:hypothetical protein